jgi:hypothetical protein
MIWTSVRRTAPAVAALMLAMAVFVPAGASAAPRWDRINYVPTAPPAGVGQPMAYDAATRQLVLFDQSNGQTWTWDGVTWTPQPARTNPSPRTGAAMDYDAATQQLILYGGQTTAPGSPAVNETWAWDGSTWTQLNPATSPPPMSLHSMSFDPASSQLVLFGADPATHNPQTWTWNGSTWTLQSPAASPPGRIDAMMGYDPVSKGVLLFGGVSGPNLLNDTWRWDGATWSHLAPTTSPPARNWGSMAVYAPTGRLLLTSGEGTGNTVLNDTWTWTGTTWQKLNPATSLIPRFGAAMAYDPAVPALVLFGGGDRLGGRTAETWYYTPLQVLTRSLSRGAVGVPYAATLLPIAGQAPFTWSVSAGTLPAGLTLSAGGVLSGTPTAAGTRSVTVKVVDGSAVPQTATRTLTFHINPAPAAGFWTAGGSILSSFGLNATSASAPRATLAGALTGLSGVGGLAFDDVA